MSPTTIILGGGPSGLGVAWGLLESGERNIVVIEKAACLGGLSGSFKREGMTLDYGPHRFSPEYPELLKKVKAILGTEFLEVSNQHAVVFRDRVYHYPPRVSEFLNTPSLRMSATVLGSFAKGKFRSWIKRPKAPPSFRTQIVENFGETLYDEVVDPLCRKVWGNPEEIDPSFAKVRFSVPTFVQWGKKWLGTKHAARDKNFFYPREGFQQLWDRLGEYLTQNGVTILLQTEAVSAEVTTEGNLSHVTYSQNGKSTRVAVSRVISTIPSEALTALLPHSDLESLERCGTVAELASRGMILVILIIKRSQCLPARVVIFPETKYAFNRLSEQNQFSRATVPLNRSAIQADIVAEVGSKLWNESDETLESTVIQQVTSLGFFSAQEIEKSFVYRVPLAYPLPTKAREEAQRNLNSFLSRYPNLVCTGRFASSDYNNSHSALEKGRALAKFLMSEAPSKQWYEQAESWRQVPIRD